MRSKEDEYVM